MNLGEQFLVDCYKRLQFYQDLGDKTLEQLSDTQLNYRPSPESNSIAIILEHLYGNMMSRFTHFLTEDGEKEWRKRDAEFEPMDFSKTDLLELWNTGWATVLRAVSDLAPGDLERYITIRSEPLQVFDALLRQLAHYAYHVGQMVVIGKMMLDAGWKNLSMPKRSQKP